MILLDDKEIEQEYDNILSRDPSQWDSLNVGRYLVKAQAKKIADAIDSMTADGWWLEDIVKAIRKEVE